MKCKMAKKKKALSQVSTKVTDFYIGDARELLAKHVPDGSVQACITSPPYFGLRAYGTKSLVWGGNAECKHRWGAQVSGSNRGKFCGKCGAWRGELGGEPTPELYVEHLAGVFDAVWKALSDDGTLWLNLGDTFAANRTYQVADSKWTDVGNKSGMTVPSGMKPKDLMGIPWMVAVALRSRGWYLRAAIPWLKRNGMCSPVTDRPTVCTETIFLFSKSARYFYDYRSSFVDATTKLDSKNWQDRVYDQSFLLHKQNGTKGRSVGVQGYVAVGKRNRRDTDWWFDSIDALIGQEEKWLAHLRQVRKSGPGGPVGGLNGDGIIGLDVMTKGYKGAHFAVFPQKLVEPMVLASTRKGDIVLDCFAGSGTTLRVAGRLGRGFIGCEANHDYGRLIEQRVGPYRSMSLGERLSKMWGKSPKKQ